MGNRAGFSMGNRADYGLMTVTMLKFMTVIFTGCSCFVYFTLTPVSFNILLN